MVFGLGLDENADLCLDCWDVDSMAMDCRIMAMYRRVRYERQSVWRMLSAKLVYIVLKGWLCRLEVKCKST